jgi:PD-(D/E)XK endonuclease
MISNPTSKGKTGEAVILAALVKLGKSVLIPWGEERYDLALDDGGKLVRIQCKTATVAMDCACFKRSITDCTAATRRWRLRGRLMRSPFTVGTRLRFEPTEGFTSLRSSIGRAPSQQGQQAGPLKGVAREGDPPQVGHRVGR